MKKVNIEDINPHIIDDGLISIEAKVIWVSDVKKTNPGNKTFRFFQRILLADKTTNILGLIKVIKTKDEALLGEPFAVKVGRFFRIPLLDDTVALYNPRFSVGEHVKEAELWFPQEETVDWVELDTVEDADTISSSIPFKFLNFTQADELEKDRPFDVLGTVVQSDDLEGHRSPCTEIRLKIIGGTIRLAVWENYADILRQTGLNGEPLKVAIKGVRKLEASINANTHVGSTADIFVIEGEDNLQIFDASSGIHDVKKTGCWKLTKYRLESLVSSSNGSSSHRKN